MNSHLYKFSAETYDCAEKPRHISPDNGRSVTHDVEYFGTTISKNCKETVPNQNPIPNPKDDIILAQDFKSPVGCSKPTSTGGVTRDEARQIAPLAVKSQNRLFRLENDF